jgi:hypothetical protein
MMMAVVVRSLDGGSMSLKENRLMPIAIPMAETPLWNRINPGECFMIEQQQEVGSKPPLYPAVLACPACGVAGLITMAQLCGRQALICGGDHCSAWFFITSDGFLMIDPQ